MSFSLVEAHMDHHFGQGRRGASSVLSSSSSCSSSTSSEIPSYHRALQSSPTLVPNFSDDIYPADGSTGPRKRARFEEQHLGLSNSSSYRRVMRSFNSSPTRSRKSRHQLFASSPLQARSQPQNRSHVSFVSTTSTIPNSPPLGSSDSEDPSLPTNFHGSPPQTPPPTRSRGLRKRKGGNNSNGEEGADLLLYLAASPSPAKPTDRTSSRMEPPSTPPTSHAALSSSFMNTPGGTNILTGFSTPGQPFNFADFVNVTPSPAQGAFNRTPGAAKTPLAAREARRKLNFDNLVPPPGSPVATRGGGNAGLGMELGGELVS